MTIRALVIGLGLTFFIAYATHFNDQVMRATFVIGNNLPPIVFGAVLLLLLLINPLLRSLSKDLPFAPGELAIIAALGLAACAWPGSNFARYFTQLVTLPSKDKSLQPNWRSTNVMSYVPGGSKELAEGFVTDWPRFAGRLAEGVLIAQRSADAVTPPPSDQLLAQLAGRFTAHDRLVVRQAATSPEGPTQNERGAIVRRINELLEHPDLFTPPPGIIAELPPRARAALAGDDDANESDADRPAASLAALPTHERISINRQLLSAAMPGLLRPAPEGEGVLLLGGRADPRITETLITGTTKSRPIGVADIPWDAWWPVIRLWGGVTLLIGLASIGMMLLVHPQWSRRELLPYPTVTFLQEMTRASPGKWVPQIATNRLFWIGFAVVGVWHLCNGFHAWYGELPETVQSIVPDVFEIPKRFDFNGLAELFPRSFTVSENSRLRYPELFFSAIGFGYFINTRVSLSLGLSLVFWLILGGWMASGGDPLTNGRFTPDAVGTMMRFGSYVGMTLMILYFGRRYYLNVLAASVKLRPLDKETPRSAVTGLWLMMICSVAAVWLLVTYTGVSTPLAAVMILIVLIILLILARINVETGLFYAQPDFVPAILILGLVGFEGVGPEATIVLMLASVVLVADPREALTPFIANGLRMGESVAKVPPRRLSRWLIAATVISLGVSLVVVLHIHYNRGFSPADGWSIWLPRGIFDMTAKQLGEASGDGMLTEITTASGWARLGLMNAGDGMWMWLIVGILLVLGCGVARIRLPWWPIHPVLFLVWGTYPGSLFAVSFLVAAAIKAGVIKLGGERGYQTVKPIMVGFIAAEIMMIVFWSIIGALYYFDTGTAPPGFRILPG